MLVPDVSRVFITVTDSVLGGSSRLDKVVVDELLGRKRKTNLSAEVKIANAQRIKSGDYEADLMKILKGAKVLDGRTEPLRRCVKMGDGGEMGSESTKGKENYSRKKKNR